MENEICQRCLCLEGEVMGLQEEVKDLKETKCESCSENKSKVNLIVELFPPVQDLKKMTRQELLDLCQEVMSALSELKQ